VIELAIDPPLHDPLDVAEIQTMCIVGDPILYFVFGSRVVPVRMLADPVVVEQPMP
jgi:hypothetical protein